MTSQTTIGLVAAGLAVMALASSANANVGDDTISRVFPSVSIHRAHVDLHGIGWYDAAHPPNVCILTSFGAELAFGGAEYYDQNLRTWPNFPGWTAPVHVPLGPATIAVPCPPVINPLCTLASGCGLQLRPIDVGPAARTLVLQSGLVCWQASAFVDCVVTDSYWAVSHCDWEDASFDARANPFKGFLAGTGINDLLLSANITCNGGLGPYYNVSYLLGVPDLVTSGIEGVTSSLVAPYGNGAEDTGFFYSCLETAVTEIDRSTPIPTITAGVVEDGEDWFSVLDADGLFLPGNPATTEWVGAAQVHLGAGNQGQLLAGLYDLGGDHQDDGSDGNTLVGPGDDKLCDLESDDAGTNLIALPVCHDGIDNEFDGHRDESDPGCYSPDPQLGGVPVYNPHDPTE